MSSLIHIVEPVGLLLTWQPQDERAPVRTRRVVGEVQIDSNHHAIFHYLRDTEDFVEARKAGFQGFPAFHLEHGDIRQGVLESLLRRLPPRKREDFDDYLASHRLPVPFSYSDIALLGYTGARLPSDGFALLPAFPPDVVPCDYLTAIAGLRHNFSGDLSNLKVGNAVTFELDSENPVDSDALAVVHNGARIGYVNRAMRGTFHHWLQRHHMTAVIDRINGKPGRPLLYVRVSVS